MRILEKTRLALSLCYLGLLSNLLGQISPTIIAPPRSQTNWAGNNIILGEAVTGTPPFSYQWFYNEVPMVGQTNALLLLPMTTTNNSGSYSVVVTNISGATTSSPAAVLINPVFGSGTVVAWGTTYADSGQTNVPPGLNGVVAIVAGGSHTVALKSDGAVVAWGDSGQNTVPADLGMVVAIATGSSHTLALKSDGTVVAWGDNYAGQTNVPVDLIGVVAISAAGPHSLALKNDGTVVAWGNNGSADVPAGLSGITAIAAGDYHTVVLKSDGTVVAWGYNFMGDTDVAGLSGVTAIAADDSHTALVKSDGSVVVLGYDYMGDTHVPVGLSGVVAVACGNSVTLALKSDGKMVAWGNNQAGQRNVPGDLRGVTAMAAGMYHSVAITTPSNQTISFAPTDKILGDPPFALNATASSGLPVSYVVLSGPATVTGNILTITGSGTIVVRATQPGNAFFNAAPYVDQSFMVNFALNTSVTGSGTLARSPELAQYTNGAVVLLNAIPDASYVFSGWSGDASGTNNPIQVVMDANKNITANFVHVIANVQLVSFNFDPQFPDVSSGSQIVTVTAHLTSGEAPLTRATVRFSPNRSIGYPLGVELGPTNLISGDLYDGIFQGAFSVDDGRYSGMYFGTYILSEVKLFDQSGLDKTYNILPAEGVFPYPAGTPTNLVLVATNPIIWFGVSWPGSVNVTNYGWVMDPTFIDRSGNFLSAVPFKNSGHTKFNLRRGETRPFMSISANWIQLSGKNMNVYCAIDTAPDTELQTDIGIRLMRAWTKDYTPGWGDVQRDFLVSPPEGALGTVPYEITMLENGSNAPTWSVLAGFVVTPPPGGFKKSFVLNSYSKIFGQSPDGTGVTIDKIAGVTAEFDVVENPTFPITSFVQDPLTGSATISWYGSAGLSYHVQWKSNLADDNWSTVTNGLIGAGAILNWTDNGTETLPLSIASRFYRISIP